MPTDPDHARTKRTRRNKRALILSEAARLFKERGYHQTGIDDIGRAAGVTGPALYHHFRGKEGVLGALIRSLLAEVQTALERVLAAHDDPTVAIEAFVTAQVELAIGERALMAISLRELRHAPDEDRLELLHQARLLRTERQHLLHQLRPELSETELWLMQDALDGVIYAVVAMDEAIDREVLRDRVVRMALAIVHHA